MPETSGFLKHLAQKNKPFFENHSFVPTDFTLYFHFIWIFFNYSKLFFILFEILYVRSLLIQIVNDYSKFTVWRIIEEKMNIIWKNELNIKR